MALNKYMHPRNIYKTPPNFAKLYKDFEEFSKIAKVDVTGKVSINFKDPLSLRVLTKCLLKSDFNLDVIIPKDRLVPTLPLRLNYILWIEDMLNLICKEDNVTGLDIGTGACAIYPLLAAVKNKWHMVGTEIDEGSLQMAEENVKRNCLQNLVKLKTNTSTTLIEHIFKDDDGLKFHFSMCNPPFYSNYQDLWESRSPARPPPKNGFTGSPQELITEGGELEFCRKLIKESLTYKNNILIFTTMIGHKYNLKELLIDLKAEGIKHTTTEFCQGRVTRWGLAWTFQNYDLCNLVPSREKPRKKSTPISFILPEFSNNCNEVQNIIDKIKGMFDHLEIKYKIITKRRNETVLNFTAFKNTWSNQRRKRRLLKIVDDTNKKQKLGDNEAIEDSNKNILLLMNQKESKHPTTPNTATENNSETDVATCSKLLNNSITKNENEKPFLQGIIKVVKKEDKNVLDLEYLDGSYGKEGIHQILQYIKNNWT